MSAPHYFSHTSSPDWACSHSNHRIDSKQTWKHGQGLLRLSLELAQCYFHHILLAKVSQKATLSDSRGGEIDSTPQWEELPSHIAKEQKHREGNNRGHSCKQYIIMCHFSVFFFKTSLQLKGVYPAIMFSHLSFLFFTI